MGLKRTPLMRGKPLKRGSKPLVRETGLNRGSVELKRGKQLNPVSKKRRKVSGPRRAFVERILTERPRCEACLPIRGGRHQRRSVDVHELIRRGQGGSILEDYNVLAVCRPCHDWIGDHPEEAREYGVAIWSWEGIDAWSMAAERRFLRRQHG